MKISSKILSTFAVIATLAAVFAGCKSVRVSTPEWSAHYISFAQSNDLKGLEVQAGKNTSLKLDSNSSAIDPAVKEAMKTAAAALAAASRACAACATGGASEAAAAVVDATSSCADGSCAP